MRVVDKGYRAIVDTYIDLTRRAEERGIVLTRERTAIRLQVCARPLRAARSG
jgi:hypothetical protein